MKMYSNSELWDLIRGVYPSFASHTAKATADLFTAQGFERLNALDPTALTDFFGLTLRVYLQAVNVSHAVDPLERAGFSEHYDNPWGGVMQRMAVNSVTPISPAYKGLKDGDSPDPFVVRKPTTAERFFKQNFDYASLITMPDEFQYKQMFVAENGMGEFMAGIMEGLQNGFTIQQYENKLEAISAALNSTKDPLKDTQKVSVVISDEPTDSELQNFILSVMNTVEAMTATGPATGAFNALGFVSTQSAERLKLLVRPGYKNALKVRTMLGAYNPGNLTLPVDVITVPHFGGLIPYKGNTRLYPAYDALGARKGWATAKGGAADTSIAESDVTYTDPNADTFAVLADKGWIFTCRQNPYTVEPIRNPRGLYTNYWAAQPNATIAVDPLYNVVVFNKAAQGG